MGMELEWDLGSVAVDDVVVRSGQGEMSHSNCYRLLNLFDLVHPLQRHAENEMLGYGDKWIMDVIADNLQKWSHRTPLRRSPNQD